jgi:two-component system response regulator BaeR
MSAALLLVEDERDLAEVAADYLRAAGYRVEVCGDGAQALARVRRAPPDLIVLDLMLPSLDGLALCRAVRSFSSLPIVMTTARVRRSTACSGWRRARTTTCASPTARANWWHG